MSRLLLLFYYCLQAKIKLELTYSAPSGGGGGGGGGDNEDDEDDGGGDDGGVWCVVCGVFRGCPTPGHLCTHTHKFMDDIRPCFRG